MLGIHKRKETNVCFVQLNVGVSHKFKETDKGPPVLFKTFAHRA